MRVTHGSSGEKVPMHNLKNNASDHREATPNAARDANMLTSNRIDQNETIVVERADDGEVAPMAFATILAAGQSSKFFPPLYDKPKGLFVYKGEVLIERQIRQLVEAGCKQIWIVLGYEKERFFYLENMFPEVKLVVNEHWADEGNVASIACAHNAFADSGAWLCCADHWYKENPFVGDMPGYSVRMVGIRANASSEFVVRMKDNRIVNIDREAASGPCMVGAAWLTGEFVDNLLDAYALERKGLGVKKLFWEDFWARHTKELPLYAIPEPDGFREFDSLGDLVGEDPAALDNVSREATDNICRLLRCEKADILDIQPLNKGLTNVSFSFIVRDEKYVYRQPGWSSENMVVRSAEVIAQNAAIELGIDPSVIAIGEDGWKLSRFVEAAHAFDYDNAEDLVAGVAQIRTLHSCEATCDHEVNLLAEGDRLMGLASNMKGNLASRLADRRTSLERLWHHVELDGAPKVLCHNDTYAVNWICGASEICLIDWEYAGMNDPMNDLATMVVRDGLSQAKYDEIVRLYLQREPSTAETRHAYGVCALCAWYWVNWALFKDTLGEDGYFMLNSWRALNHYLPLALDMYDDAPMGLGDAT